MCDIDQFDLKAQRIFISYRHVKPDEDLAKVFESELKRNGFQVFVDRNMGIGAEWAGEIDRRLKKVDFFLVLLSEESIRGDRVRQETELGHELKQRGKLRILPETQFFDPGVGGPKQGFPVVEHMLSFLFRQGRA